MPIANHAEASHSPLWLAAHLITIAAPPAMALHTEGEARARFAAAISAEHFAAVAQARLRGEAASADGSADDGAPSPLL